MKSLSNIIALALITTGVICGLVELALFINRPFMYLLGCGLSVLAILGAFEIAERSRDKQ